MKPFRAMGDEDFKKFLEGRPDLSIISEFTSGVTEQLLDPVEKEAFNKLGAKKVLYAGFLFDSKFEWRRYMQLLTWQRLGLIRDLDCLHKWKEGRTKEDIERHTWILQEGFIHEGKKIRAITYTDDFQYVIVETEEFIVEDIKGFVTASFKRSAKMFKKRYPNVNFFLNYRVNGFYQEGKCVSI